MISLLACDRMILPKEEEEDEEYKRGGTKKGPNVPRSIEDPGQRITIHAVPEGYAIRPNTPSLAQEFF